jgi:imidazolonepropionase-like amidohydrolase
MKHQLFRTALAAMALWGVVSAVASAAPAWGDKPQPGEVGGPELVLSATKVLTCARKGAPVIDHGIVAILDGRLSFVGKRVDLPESVRGRVFEDVGDNWLMPGMIDLHTHESGISLYKGNDLNDLVFLTNPGLRASAAVQPGNPTSMKAAGAGVTSVLYIPGSGSNIGGAGVLLKTGFDRYEDAELRNPGSMKLAQAGNPERFAWGVGRSFMNWHTRDTLQRGLAYARAWEAGTTDEVDPQWELFRGLLDKTVQVSTHTQVYQVVLETLTMVRQEFGLDVYIDHGTIGAWKLGGLAESLGVPAIIGPRNVDAPARRFMGWAANMKDEGWRGVAAGYQQAGNTHIGFNTDAPIVSDEEYSLQAAMAVHFGFEDSEMQAVRGLTIIPAMAAGIADEVGSLEVGKHADVLVISGHPADPRSRISTVFIEGRKIHDRIASTSNGSAHHP